MPISKNLLMEYKGKNVRISVNVGATSSEGGFSTARRFIGLLLDIDDKFVKIEETYGRFGRRIYLVNIDYIISLRLA